MSLRPRLLVIDDVIENLEILGDLLATDYDVQCALSGREGLGLMRQTPPDLILLDVMMPEMDGYDVFEALKARPETRDIPVIFVTAQNDSDSETHALSAGAADFISKPINAKVVLARVKTQLNLRQHEREVQQLNSQLEDKVRERTRQVEALNQALEERARQAEAANQTKTRFLGNMSHELRTPMSAIMGYSDLLQKKITDPVAAQQLSNISKAARHLANTINEILDFSQVESGNMTPVASDFELTELLSQIEETNREAVLAKKLRYVTQIDPALPTHLVGDAGKVEQVLLNLTANAIKFTREGTIEVKAEGIAASDDNVTIRLSVQDTGIGIAPAQLQQIFLPFEQADTSLTREYGGVGLGLSINHQLIALLGGEMGVTSDEGKGSCFWVTLKFKRGQFAPITSPELTPLQQLQALPVKPWILLVDDDFFNQSIFSLLLEQAILHFAIANDGAEAVAKSKARRYDLILMDVQMPIMNGLDATRAIRQLPGHQETPIVAISANAFDEDRARCFEVGMNAFIAKPVTPDHLYAEIARWLVVKPALDQRSP